MLDYFIISADKVKNFEMTEIIILPHASNLCSKIASIHILFIL